MRPETALRLAMQADATAKTHILEMLPDTQAGESRYDFEKLD